MKKYKIEDQLIDTFEVEANTEEEAFQLASDYAIHGSSWGYDVLDVEDIDEEEQECY